MSDKPNASPLRDQLQQLVEKKLRHCAHQLHELSLDIGDGAGSSSLRWWRVKITSEQLNNLADLLAAPARVCGEPAPDRSSRTCDKPKGHDGDHWTYGGETLTWAAPQRDGWQPEGPVILKASADIELQWAERVLDSDRASTRKHIANARDLLARLGFYLPTPPLPARDETHEP